VPAPRPDEVLEYVTGAGSTAATAAEVGTALEAETAAQARACRVPAPDAYWPADLAEALCRRVARNLAMRNLPLAVQMSEMGGTRIGSIDPEVRRLEAPYRKVVLG